MAAVSRKMSVVGIEVIYKASDMQMRKKPSSRTNRAKKGAGQFGKVEKRNEHRTAGEKKKKQGLQGFQILEMGEIIESDRDDKQL